MQRCGWYHKHSMRLGTYGESMVEFFRLICQLVKQLSRCFLNVCVFFFAEFRQSMGNIIVRWLLSHYKEMETRGNKKIKYVECYLF